MAKLLCTVCNSVMDEEECLHFSQCWNDDLRATEHFAGLHCPECGADGEFLKEVDECIHCGNYFEKGTLRADVLCDDCIDWILRNWPNIAKDYLEDQRDEFAEYAATKI